jgi:hypothetical protein
MIEGDDDCVNKLGTTSAGGALCDGDVGSLTVNFATDRGPLSSGAQRCIPFELTWRFSAARAVGLANGANSIAIVIPRHRVIGVDGALAGYGSGSRENYGF